MTVVLGGIEIRDKVSELKLLYGLMFILENEIACARAEHIGENIQVKMMNDMILEISA